MKKKSMINWIIAGIFILFAAFQWNDPDPFLWIGFYGALALMIILHQLGFNMQTFFGISAALVLAYGLYLFPSCLRWVQAGMPSLTGEMQAGTPEIEAMRELGGVLIVFVATFIYWRTYKEV